jgi:hypothetical protein
VVSRRLLGNQEQTGAEFAESIPQAGNLCRTVSPLVVDAPDASHHLISMGPELRVLRRPWLAHAVGGVLLASSVMPLSAHAQICRVLPDGRVVVFDSTNRCTMLAPVAMQPRPSVTTRPIESFTTGQIGPFTTGSIGPFTTGPIGPFTTFSNSMPPTSRRR